MDANSIQKAKLLAAVICRIVDYHVVSQREQSVVKAVNKNGSADAIATCERAVAVALENVIDEGVLE